MSAPVASVLQEDPDLAAHLKPERLGAASERAWARVWSLTSGPWPEVEWPPTVRFGIGLLVLDGLLLRRVELHDRQGAELLGPGDLLRPWQREDEAVASMARRPAWEVLTPTRLAILDLAFVGRIGAYPEVLGELVGRAIRRSRHLAVNMAIVHQPRVQTRVHMLLWDLADRWGRVSPEGVLVPVRLTHLVLATLVAARRPTVSVALRSLKETGAAERVAGGWILRGGPPRELAELGADVPAA